MIFIKKPIQKPKKNPDDKVIINPPGKERKKKNKQNKKYEINANI